MLPSTISPILSVISRGLSPMPDFIHRTAMPTKAKS